MTQTQSQSRTQAAADFALTREQVKQFTEQGFLGPFAACSPDEMTRDWMPRIEHALGVDAKDGTFKPQFHNRHIDSRVIYDLVTRQQIVDRMASVYGNDLMIWRTHFFIKEQGAGEIPWHQDANYWPLEPEIVISAWIAIDEATIENSCVQLIPGSHRKLLPHVTAKEGMLFKEMAKEGSYNLDDAIDMEMKPGEFFLFNERTLHHSYPNTSSKRRMGLALRAIVPIVNVLDYDADNHGMVMLSGEDRMGLNRTADPPTE